MVVACGSRLGPVGRTALRLPEFHRIIEDAPQVLVARKEVDGAPPPFVRALPAGAYLVGQPDYLGF